MAYAGQVVPIVTGADGGYGIQRIPLSGLLKFMNLTFENSQWEKEGGATTQTATGLVTGAVGIVAMFDWWPDPATQRFIAVGGNGAVYRDLGAWTFPTTVLAAAAVSITTKPPHLVSAGVEKPGNNRKLVLFTGNDPPQVGSGDFTTMAALATPAADWTGARQPVCGVVHQGRLFAALGHTLYWSTPTNHEDFQGAGSGSIPIAPGEGQEIRCLVSSRRMLIVLKYPTGVYIVDTSDASITNWRYDPQSFSVGVAGPWAGIAIPNDVLLVDSMMNLHLLSATDVSRDARSSDISSPKLGTWIQDNLDPNRSPWAQAVWYAAKHRAEIACSSLGAVLNNRRLLVDFNNPDAGVRFSLSDRDSAQSMTMRLLTGVARPYLGTSTGTVIKLDDSTRSKDGVGYTARAQFDHSDLGEIVPQWKGKRKNFDYVEFEAQAVGAYPISINVYIDGKLKTTTPLTIQPTGVGVPLGTFLIGTDRLATTGYPQRVRKRLTWQGTRISVEVFNSGPGQTFQIPRLFIGARLAE